MIEETSKQILSKVPQPIDIVDLMERHPVLYEESMNTVLQQEVRLMLNFLVKMNILCQLFYSSIVSA